ncbi:MAG: lipoprotein-releasing ABC transporter permease subunit [Gammaproteobacteria bacterium]|nr:lipoprotein-releasing ABC transporter permease subunit [Gammaproteobacteria bacterium]
MFNSVTTFISFRYLKGKRRNRFISFISLASMVGLSLSIAVLITVLAVINGFESELQKRVLGLVPQAKLYGYEGVGDWQSIAAQVIEFDGVEGVAPMIELQGMLTANKQLKPVFVTGIEPQYEKEVSIISRFLTDGSLENLKAGEYGIVLDKKLAEELGVSLGERVTLVMPEAIVSPAGLVPRYKRFRLVGVFDTGAELGEYLVYIHLHDAAKILRIPNQVHGVRIKVTDLFAAPFIVQNISRQLSVPLYATDWTRTHGNLYSAIKMQKGMIALLLLLIVAVAIFNVVASLVMVVNEKKADIAILQTLGAGPRQILIIFMLQGTAIGVVGCAFGVIIGVLLAYFLGDLLGLIQLFVERDLMQAYFIHYLPTELHGEDVLSIVLAALFLTVVATLYPAYRAARTQPAEALRFE